LYFSFGKSFPVDCSGVVAIIVIVQKQGGNMPTDEEYGGDMLVDECPDEDKEAMDKYLNILN
jgi:hypothetical protein